MEENTKKKKRGKEKGEWERIMGINRKKGKGKGGRKGDRERAEDKRMGNGGKVPGKLGKGSGVIGDTCCGHINYMGRSSTFGYYWISLKYLRHVIHLFIYNTYT
jgi:hypothetical protein